MESLDHILNRIARSSSSGDISRLNGPGATADEASDPTHCDVCDDARWLRVDEPFGSPDFGKLVPCECQERVWGTRRPDRLKRYSNLGPLTRCTFEATLRQGRDGFVDPASFRAATEASEVFAEEPDGWLVLLGPSGSGKTHLAAAVANRCVDMGRPVLFISVPDLIDQLRVASEPGEWTAYDDLLHQVIDAPLLVLDDLGARAMTRWAEEKLDQILTTRYNARRPTVITSIQEPSLMDERLRTRLLDPSLSTVREIRGGSGHQAVSAANIPVRMLETMTFDTFDPRGARGTDPEQQDLLRNALLTARSFAEQPDRWLYLSGPTGTGKTHLAVAIANVRLTMQRQVTFTFVPELLDHLRQAFSPDSRVRYDRLFEDIKNSELLVLDDLGAHTSTAWAEEKLYQLIVHRYNSALPTVITSRVLITDAEEPEQPAAPGRARKTVSAEFSEAIMSRLRDGNMVSERVLIVPDYRNRGLARPITRRPPRQPRRDAR